MAVTNTPYFTGRFAFVRSRCPVKVHASNTIVNAGTRSEWQIQFLEATIAGDTVTVTYGGDTFTMVCALSLAEPYRFQPGETAAEAAQRFYAAALNTYHVDRDFDLEYAGGVIVRFIAKRPGIAYQRSSVVADPPTRTSNTVTVAGVDPQKAANIQVGLSLFVTPHGASQPERVTELAAEPGTDSIAEFDDIGAFLEPYVRDVEQLPFIYAVLPQPVILDKSRRPFSFRTWERYGTPPQNGPLSAIGDSNFTAVYAGIERIERPRFNTWFASALTVPHRFLTGRGRTIPRYVTRSEQVWLSAYNAYNRTSLGGGNFEAIQLLARIHYADGVPDGPWQVKVNNLHTTGVAQGQFAAWPAGWDMLHMIATGGTPIGYSVLLRGAVTGTVITETYRFDLVDPDYNELHIQFFSSLGCWETMRTTGAWARSRSSDQQPILRHLTGQQVHEGKEAAHSSEPLSKPDVLVVNTGHHPLLEHECLMDIIGSPQIRLVDHRGLRFIPLRFDGVTEQQVTKRGTDEEHLHTAELRFLADDPNEFHTFVLGSMDDTAPEDPGFELGE